MCVHCFHPLQIHSVDGDAEKACLALRQVALQGVPGIKKVSIRETKIMLPDAEAAEGFRNENTWVLDTEGTNLLDVSLSHPVSS